jgi:hypothetical protein
VNELKWLLLILIVLILFILLLVFTKITIYLNYYHQKDDDHLKIEIRALYGIIRYKKNIPLIKVDDQSPSLVVKGENEINNETKTEKTSKITPHDVITNLKNFKEVLEHVVELNRIIKKFLKKVSVKKFEWNTIIGVGDALYTGVISGALWTIKGSLMGLLSDYFSFKEMPQLMVHPNFNQMIARTNLSCMFQFRTGHAMLAGLKLVKFWKGGKPSLKSTKIVTNEKSKSL